MRKILVPLVAVLFIISGVFALRFVLGGNEDSWNCVYGQWVKHGNPSGPPPATGCIPTPAPTSTVPTDTPAPEPSATTETIPPDDVIIEGMSKAFAAKYDKPESSFILSVSDKDETHAKGLVQLKGEAGGGLWFGAKTVAGWVLAFDGNGIVDCASINPYNFSSKMIPSCIDTASGNALIQR